MLSVENGSRLLFGYGAGEQTHDLLSSVYNRFGPISSFTGTFQADEWTLTINRELPNNGINNITLS